MPFNGSNTFSILNTFVPGTTILSSAVNANFSDIATGLSDCVTRDAQGPVTGNLVFSATGFLGIPSGSTAQRPSAPGQGYFRFNSTTVGPEIYDGTTWDSMAATIVQPQGYLTLTNIASGGPITFQDVTAATSVYYSPFVGQVCPVYNGSIFVNQPFSEQTLTLVSQHLSSTIYDVFGFLNSGSFAIGTGPAWTNSGIATGARGTGAGTTQLQRLNGLLTNQNQITLRNGSTTFTVSANQATYLGSIYINAVAGQISCHVSYGQARKWGVWNCYNRQPIFLQEGDPATSWSYTTVGYRQANNSSNNYLDAFTGLSEETYDIEYEIFNSVTLGAGTATQPIAAIGFNSVTPFGVLGIYKNSTDSGNTSNVTSASNLFAKYLGAPNLGLNRVYPIENGNGSNASVYFGTSSAMMLTTKYRG